MPWPFQSTARHQNAGGTANGLRDILPRLADLVIRAGAIHSMAANRAIYRAVALRDEWIVAVSADPHGLDDLIAPGTQVLDDPTLTVLPAFFDTHNHLLEAARNFTTVPVDQAHTVAEFLELIRERAATTPPGDWIRTTNGWNEADLAEERLPTAAELDSATSAHPVLVRRGGHTGVANSLALARAGITKETPNPPGGAYGRLPDGTPNGVLEGAAVYVVAGLVPPLSFEEQVAALHRTCQTFNALGMGAVRDPLIQRDELLIYQATWERGLLSLRCHPMVLVTPSGTVAERIGFIEGLGIRSGFGDAWLRVWGLKFVMDGGVEGAALDAPYASTPGYSGHLNWHPDEMEAVVNAAVRRGWRIGTHAAGDRATRTVLDVYERVLAASPNLAPGTLVLEHALLAPPEQRARAIRLGIPITVQHPLLYTLGARMVTLWGAERASQALPVHSWLREGATLSAGSDYPAGGYDAALALWGLVSRATQRAGVLGSEEAIDQYSALDLYTRAGAQLAGEEGLRGTLQPHRLADLTAFTTDPTTCPVDELRSLRPVFTVMGGRAVYDPTGLLGAPPS
jgi:predicted amidohydrolase YtcJ